MQTIESEDKKICQFHKLEIVVVDLNVQTKVDNKYYCTMCLVEKFDNNNNMTMINQVNEMIKNMTIQSERIFKEEQVLRLSSLQQLQSSIKSFKVFIKTELTKLLQQIDLYIEQIQKEVESQETKLEKKNFDDQIQILSQNYKGNLCYNIQLQEINKEKDFQLAQFVQESLLSYSKSQNFDQIMKSIELIISTIPINLQKNIIYAASTQEQGSNENKICKKHNQEIIMINISQEKSEFSRWACIECIEENPIQYVSLKEAKKRWINYIDQSKDLIFTKTGSRKQKLQIILQKIKQIKTNLNNQLQEILIIIEKQITEDYQTYEDFLQLGKKQIFELEKTQFEKLINLLIQKEKNKEIQEQQEKQAILDYKVYSNINTNLDSLLEIYLLSKQQLLTIILQQDSQQIGVNNFLDTKLIPEMHQFISKIEIQIQYLNNLNEPIKLQQELKQDQHIEQQDQCYQQLKNNEIIQQQQLLEITEQQLRLQFEEKQETNQINQLQIQEIIVISKNIRDLENNLNRSIQIVDQEQGQQQYQQQDLFKQYNLQEKFNVFDEKLQQLTVQIIDLKSEFIQINQQKINLLQSGINQSQFKFEENMESKFQILNQQIQFRLEENYSQIKILEQYQQSLSELVKEVQKSNETIYQLINNVDQQNTQIQKLFEIIQLSQKQQHLFEALLKPKIEIFLKLQLIPGVKPTLLNNNFWIRLFSYIQEQSKKNVKSSQLVYKGSQDGLNSNSFWNCCKGKGYLLMIFKSLSGNVFGGYSPCVWQHHSGIYVQDDSLTSFLFSQKHDQIYPLIKNRKQYAIRCNSSHGPKFGYAHDISIYSDFKSGYSKIGDTYQCNNYQDKQSSYLFGQDKPNIIECEVYELIFT
ncbi:unnamed protein product [Paramecium pentaurelia]|uniref:TLDc domain-containing protein n=1 Tax=Paramecium pentaurelia TaxID=43138 RepID=A0A8S1TNP5_9CILI|nr:unnamed protein product [Paramecium pentaurelia]